VHAHADRVKTNHQKDVFARSVRKWIEGRVAKHKFLRGGMSFSSKDQNLGPNRMFSFRRGGYRHCAQEVSLAFN